MEIRLLTENEEFASLKERWEKLEQQDSDVTYFSTYKYIEAWWNFYCDKPDLSLFVLCAYNNNQVVGIAPLVLVRRRVFIFTWNELRFMGKGDFSSFIVENTAINGARIVRKLFRAIEYYAGVWNRIRLTHIRQDSKLAHFLFASREYNESFVPLVECPYIDLRKYLDFNDYASKFISGDTRNHLKKLSKEKGCSFQAVNNGEQDVYESISRIHRNEQHYLRKELNRKERQSIYEDSRNSCFLRSVYRDNEKIVTYMLLDGIGDTVNYRSCYLYKGVLHCWNIGFNPLFRKYNSGRVIHLLHMEYLFKHRTADILDFGTGRYSWKFEWTDDFVMDYMLDVWDREKFIGKVISKLQKMKKAFGG